MSSYLAAEQAASARLKRDTYLAKDLANAMVYLNKATVSCGVPATVISEWPEQTRPTFVSKQKIIEHCKHLMEQQNSSLLDYSVELLISAMYIGGEASCWAWYFELDGLKVSFRPLQPSSQVSMSGQKHHHAFQKIMGGGPIKICGKPWNKNEGQAGSPPVAITDRTAKNCKYGDSIDFFGPWTDARTNFEIASREDVSSKRVFRWGFTFKDASEASFDKMWITDDLVKRPAPRPSARR